MASGTTRDGGASRTTVLAPGTVESRGYGADKSRSAISSDIRSFIAGEAKFGPRSELRCFFTVWMFIGRLPSPSWVDLHPGFLMRGMGYFPVAGSVLGAALAVVLNFASVALGLPAAVAAAISVGAGLCITGCFHEDGLADSADGMGGGWSKSQVLRIMTDSRVGTFGCAALSLFLFMKLQLLGELGKDAGPALVVSQTLARLSAPFLIRTRPYVPEVGPKSSFYLFMVEAKHLVSWWRVLFATLYCYAVASILYSPSIAIALIVAVFAFANLAGRKGQYLLGGVMGDFLGGTICLCELLVLSLLLAKESIADLYRFSIEALLSTQEGGDKLASAVLVETASILWTNERIRSIVHVLGLALFLRIYCSRVGPADMYDREESITLSDGDNNDQRSSEKTEKLDGEPSPRDAAEKVLSSKGSTFNERYEAAQTYLDALAKPVGSLGTLEEWAARLAALQQTLKPDATNAACLIFAGDHGAAAAPTEGGEGCSLYPQAVTRSILVGLEREVGGASVLAKSNGVELRVVDVGVIGGAFDGKAVISSPDKLSKGTRNYCIEPAMTAEECTRCMRIGRESLVKFVEETSSKVICLGEVGIGNTTSSSAIIAALTGEPADSLCGGGAFASKALDQDAVSKKIRIVKKALALHAEDNAQASMILSRLGGAEIASLVGAMLEASERSVAVLVDGFIATAAALVAVNISPNVCHVLFLTTNSAEKGQRAAIERIQIIAERNGIPMPISPALSMSLRMGEGTAALLSVPLLRSACSILSDMATIADILK